MTSAPTLSPFAAIEQSINTAASAMLANAVAVYEGGVAFGVIFDRAPADPFGSGAVDTASHTCDFCLANAPGLRQGSELLINGVAYVVDSGVQPDAGGWVSLGIYPKD